MTQPIAIDVITDKRGGLVAQSSYGVWCAMVDAAWCGTLASMSLLLQRSADEPTVAMILGGMSLSQKHNQSVLGAIGDGQPLTLQGSRHSPRRAGRCSLRCHATRSLRH